MDSPFKDPNVADAFRAAYLAFAQSYDGDFDLYTADVTDGDCWENPIGQLPPKMQRAIDAYLNENDGGPTDDILAIMDEVELVVFGRNTEGYEPELGTAHPKPEEDEA